MAARTAVRGLSSDELQSIRDTLAAGRKPKVVFTESAGQIAGQFGQVVLLTDPAASDDWVVVRFGRDELPFSPADLAIPPRGAARRAVEVKPEPEPEPPAAPMPEFMIAQPPAPAVPAPREESSVMSASKGAESASLPVPPPAPAEGRGGRRPGAAGKGKPKSPAALTVTLAYAEGEWTVGATQGSKALAKPYVIKPAEALKMVSLLDVPGVHEAVEQIVTAERAQAQAQADRLRAELAEIEQRLAELRDAG